MNTHKIIQRRAFLGQSARGVGAMALASLLNPGRVFADEPTSRAGVVSPLHFAPKAKRVSFLSMAGGPSHLETLDYKPELAKQDGQPMPESFDT